MEDILIYFMLSAIGLLLIFTTVDIFRNSQLALGVKLNYLFLVWFLPMAGSVIYFILKENKRKATTKNS